MPIKVRLACLRAMPAGVYVSHKLQDPCVVALLSIMALQLLAAFIVLQQRAPLEQPAEALLTPPAFGVPAVPTVCTSSNLKYDLVLTTGRRKMLGATLASTFASLAASRATIQVETLHLVLRDEGGSALSLLHNLAHMPWVRVHIASSKFEPNANLSSKATYYNALLAPDALGSPSELPCMIVEDDIWFVDDFPTKLQQVVESARQQAPGENFFLSAYRPDDSLTLAPLRVRAAHMEQYHKRMQQHQREQEQREQQQQQQEEQQEQQESSWLDWFRPQRRRRRQGPEEQHHKQQQWQQHWRAEQRAAAARPYIAEAKGYIWGTQAVLFSSGELRRQCAEFYRSFLPLEQELQDFPLSRFLGDRGVRQFYPDRSLVQHTGASSTIWGPGRNNQKFHRASTFPFFERWVTDDAAEDWV